MKCHSYIDDAKESKKGTFVFVINIFNFWSLFFVFAVKHHRSSSLTCSPPRSNLSVIDKDISGTKSSQGSPLNLRKHVMLNNLQNVDSVDHSDVDFFKRRLGILHFRTCSISDVSGTQNLNFGSKLTLFSLPCRTTSRSSKSDQYLKCLGWFQQSWGCVIKNETTSSIHFQRSLFLFRSMPTNGSFFIPIDFKKVYSRTFYGCVFWNSWRRCQNGFSSCHIDNDEQIK